MITKLNIVNNAMNMMKVLEPIVAEFPELQELHAIRDASKLPRTCLGRGWVMPTRSVAYRVVGFRCLFCEISAVCAFSGGSSEFACQTG